MEFVLLEGAFVALAVLEVLGAFTVEHAVVPVTFVLSVTSFSVEDSPSALHSISKISLIPAAIRPPEGSSTISFSRLKLPFIDIIFFASPSIHPSSFLLIKPKLANIVVSGCKVELSMSFKLTIMELPTDNFMCIFEEADAIAMRSIDLSLSNVDNFSIFEKFGWVEGRLGGQHSWWTIFDNKQFFEFELNWSQLSADKRSFVVEIVQVKLCLSKHFFLWSLVYLKFAAHPSDQQTQRTIHVIYRFEFAGFDLI